MTAISIDLNTSQIEAELTRGGPINIGDELTCRLIVTGITRTAVEAPGYDIGTRVLEGVPRVELTVADPRRS